MVYVDDSVKGEFIEGLGNEQNLRDGFFTGLEGLQRAAEHTPGAQTKPVQTLRSWKGKIIEKTKQALTSDDEGVAETNKAEYQQNYNHVSRVGEAALQQREIVKAEMRGLARKIEQSHLNTGSVDQEGVKMLEGLAREYNEANDVLRDVSSMRFGEVYREERQFQQVLGKAESYGIKPFVPGQFADAALILASAAGAYYGHKVVRAGTKAAYAIKDGSSAIIGAGKKCVDGARAVGGGISKLFGKTQRTGNIKNGGDHN